MKAERAVQAKARSGADLSDPLDQRDEFGYPVMLLETELLSPLDKPTRDERSMPGQWDERHEDSC